ncbi:hypothetical protein Taro_026286, partial [Colocasia esculenta]|nr:hypothetical protein [Colocasia esculenta]
NPSVSSQSQQLSRERAKLHPSDDGDSAHPDGIFRCFSTADLKSKMLARLIRTGHKEGQWSQITVMTISFTPAHQHETDAGVVQHAASNRERAPPGGLLRLRDAAYKRWSKQCDLSLLVPIHAISGILPAESALAGAREARLQVSRSIDGHFTDHLPGVNRSGCNEETMHKESSSSTSEKESIWPIRGIWVLVEMKVRSNLLKNQ